MNDRKRATQGIFAVCALLVGPAAFAQENDQQPLTLRRAVTLSLEHSSELAQARARYALAEGQEARARIDRLERARGASWPSLEVEGARLEESDKWVAFLRADYDSQQAQLELFKTTGQIGRLFP
jgi:hypothetical protein